jgi:uncharacterized protein YbjT (DUF2867 family)
MNILLTGASGFIGQPLAAALLQAGHVLVCVLRPGGTLPGVLAPPGQLALVELDFASALDRDDWLPLLRGVDMVINTVGIFREHGPQTFERVHTRAPMALFGACVTAGVQRVVQLSALGADIGAGTAFLRSKKVADDHLLALPLEGVVVQPSLVYAPGGPSAALFDRLAAIPLLALPQGDGPWLQPVHRDDVVAGLVSLANRRTLSDPARRRIVFAGPQALTLADYLRSLRQQLGFTRQARVIRIPRGLFAGLGGFAEKLPGSLVTRDAVDMLLRGNTGDASAFSKLLGRPPRPVGQFLQPGQSRASRHEALLRGLVPMARLSLAIVWLWTGIVSAGLYPVQESYALLARVGATGWLATLLLYGAALLDFALGAATLLFTARWRRPLWLIQLALIGGYTVIISVFLPEYWLHPYGPVLKNLPMLMLIAFLYALEPPRI